MELASTTYWCWIIPIIVGMACAYLGYLYGKGSNGSRELNNQVTSLNDQKIRLEQELLACRDKLAGAGYVEAFASHVFNPKAARAVFGKRIREDDLKLVEGIGPKIEGLFHNYDIKTWKALSETSVSKCQEVLDSGGDRYQVHDPASWPMQAKMAFEGRWKELFRWQEEHKHGKL